MKRQLTLTAVISVAIALALCTTGAGTARAASEAPSGAAGIFLQPLFARIEAAPGDLVTHVFRIENASDRPVEVGLTFDLPAGWFDLGVPSQLLLPPRSSQDIFLTVIVPYQAYGVYTIRAAAAAGELTAAAETVVFVRGGLGVDVRSSGEEQVFAGMRATRRFTVVNTGNAPDTYALTGTSRRGWPVSVSPQRLTLLPGESGTVELHVTIPKDARGTDVATLRAVSVTDPQVADEETANLRIAGMLAEPEPIVAVLRARSVVTFDPQRQTGRATLSAGGTLDPDSRDGRSLNLAMEVPLPRFWEPARPVLTRLVYERPGLRVNLGAVAVKEGALSGIDGYGADLGFLTGDVSWGVTAVDEGRYALRTSLARGSWRAFGMLAFDAPGQPAVVAAGGAVSGSVSWAEWALRAEAAGRLGPAVPLSAVRIQGDALVGRNRLSLSAESREPGFGGADGGSRLSAVWLNYTDWLGNLGVFASLSVPGAGFQGETQVLDERVYLGRALAPGFFLYVQHHGRWRRSGATPVDGELGLSAGMRLNPLERLPTAALTLQLSGARHTRDAGATTLLQTGAQVGLELPVGTATVGSQAVYRQVFGSGGSTGRNLGLTLSLRTAAGTSGILEARLRSDWNLVTHERSLTQSLRYSYQITDGVSLTARAERTQSGDQDVWALFVEGAFDFDLPTPVPIKGSVEGRLVPSAPGINTAGIILRIGELRALTGPDGTFVFPALPPGEHVIHVEGLPARVLTVPERITVEVRPGRTARVEIGLQAAAGVESRFVLVTPQDTGPSGRRPILEGIRLTLLRDGRTVAEARTRSDGSLQFPDLAPGTYELVLDAASLPPGVIAPEVRRSVTVGEGEWHVVEWTVQALPPVIFFDALKPSAAFTYVPQAPRAGEPVVFRERATVDIQRRVASWVWEFGDGHRAEGPEVTHVFAEPGAYRVTLTVTDSAGDWDAVSAVVKVQ